MTSRRNLLLLLALLQTGCGEPPAQVTIPFSPIYGTTAIGCNETGAAAQLSDLRFYVSDVQLISADGASVAVRLTADGRWQQPDLALLDFEDGTGGCDNGTRETNTALQGVAEHAEYAGLQFTVGVPFPRNHADPLQAEPPLGDAAMHWHWRAGYKFLRVGVRTPDDGFWLHLGSTACEGTVRNITGCRSPNRVTVRLDGFVPGRDAVAIDLQALLAGVNLDDSVASDCSSGPAEQACDAPFRALGLDFSGTGPRTQQSVFRRRVAQ